MSGQGENTWENMGTVRSVHAATNGAALSRNLVGALGQSGLSPRFRELVTYGGL
jgi:hypothetical protein